jgi:hypothetical protein
MTDIIKLAREAGMAGMLTDIVCTRAELERFAELVAAPLKAENEALRTSLLLVKDCLMQANEQVNGPIVDTIWYSPHETLFDYIDDAARAKEQT